MSVVMYDLETLVHLQMRTTGSLVTTLCLVTLAANIFPSDYA